jgi:hypothetical protein
MNLSPRRLTCQVRCCRLLTIMGVRRRLGWSASPRARPRPRGPAGWVGEQPLDQLTQLVRLRVGSDTFPDGAVETGDIVADHERSAGARVVGAVRDEAVGAHVGPGGRRARLRPSCRSGAGNRWQHGRPDLTSRHGPCLRRRLCLHPSRHPASGHRERERPDRPHRTAEHRRALRRVCHRIGGHVAGACEDAMHGYDGRSA